MLVVDYSIAVPTTYCRVFWLCELFLRSLKSGINLSTQCFPIRLKSHLVNRKPTSTKRVKNFKTKHYHFSCSHNVDTSVESVLAVFRYTIGKIRLIAPGITWFLTRWSIFTKSNQPQNGVLLPYLTWR